MLNGMMLQKEKLLEEVRDSERVVLPLLRAVALLGIMVSLTAKTSMT